MTAYSAITTCALPDTPAAVLAKITPQMSARSLEMRREIQHFHTGGIVLFPITAQVRRNSDTRSRNRLRRINPAYGTIVLGELRKRLPSTEQEGDGYPPPPPSI